MPFLKPFLKEIPRSKRLEKASQRNGLRHTIYEPNGCKYIGEWKDDKKSGTGKRFSKTGTTFYEGDFENDLPHGIGVTIYLPGNKNAQNFTSRGRYINGKLSSDDGVVQHRSGMYYKGVLKHGKREGYGMLWYANGDFYAGNFVNDKCHGSGMFVYMNGNRYEGEWMNGAKHGAGRFFYLDSGMMQEGVWVNGMCVSSTFTNIPFRQRALYPTYYPLQKLETKERTTHFRKDSGKKNTALAEEVYLRRLSYLNFEKSNVDIKYFNK